MNSSVDPTHPVPVAIIGMGCLFPKAEDLSRYWANIRNRLDAITEVPATHWRPEDYFDGDPKAPDRTYARRGGFLDPADFPALEFGIAPNNLEATDTTQLLGLLVAREALKDAGYGSDRKFDRNRVSVILGVTGTLELVIPLGARLGHPIWRRALKNAGVPDNTAEEVVRGIADSYVSWQENSFPGLLGNVAAGRIANRLDLGGTNCVVDAACASSLGAVHLAVLELASRRSDMVLTGGLDTFNDIFMYMCFSKTPALSPTGNARPFDVSGDGTILGEGLGVLALKRLDDAQRDNDRIYAVIRSIGTSSDGKVGAVYAPSSDGQVKALKQAYELGNVSPSSIELLEAHGTGTKVGDAVELAALNQVYRGQEENEAGPTWCALGSVKSQIGHTKAAAGAAGLIKAALALHHKVLPPTAKVDQPVEAVAPGASPFYVNTEPRPWMPQPSHPRRAAVSAFGFGGSNFHCVLEEAEAQKQVIDWDGDVQILAFSADRPETLLQELKAFPDPGKLSWPQVRVEAGRSRGRFQANAPYRLSLVVEREGTSLASLLSQAVAVVERGTASNGKAAGTPGRATPNASGGEAIFFEAGAPKGQLGFLFPGQGAQYAGMLRSLTCRFPQVHDALAEANRVPLNDGRRLADLIYPHPAFNDADRDRQQAALRATQVAQPALGALGLGMYRLLEHFGVQPDAVAGHSYGELTALCAAGRIDARTLDLLSRKRGELMAGDGQEQERGSMLAVAAPLEQVEAVIREAGLDLLVANKNAPRQAVLSGPSAEIEKATRCFEERKIVARRLPVSGAFHSRFVASASGPFLETLRNVPFGQGRIPVYSNTTATPYPAEADAARTLLAGQLAQPVEFVAEIEAMHQAGVRTFLEVGPDARLTGLVRSILEGRDHNALAVDASRGQRGALYDLASALARLATLGHAVELARWDDGVDLSDQSGRKPALTVKISGANLGPKPQAPAASATPAPVSSASSSSTPSHSSLNGKASPTKEAPASTARPRTVEPTTPHSAQAQAAPASGSAPRIVQSTPARPSSTHAGTPAPLERNGTHVDYPMNATNGSHPRTSPSPARATGQPIPSLRSSDPQLLNQALEKAQENLIALQKLSEQTSSLHRQFLDGQDKAQRSFQTLLEQQQKLTYASLGLVELAPIPSAYHPAPEPSRGHEHPPASPRFHAPTPSAAPAPVTPTPAQVSSPAPAPMSHQPQARVQPSAPTQAPTPAVATPRPQPAPVAKSAPAPVPVPTPAARPLAHASPSADRGRIQGVLLAVVSEKTGYPAEMLEPDMLLDADLGIDSIKRVEILAAIQEQLPDAPVVKPEHLGTLRTLGHIVEFLAGPAAATNTGVPATPSQTAQAQAPSANHAAQIQDVLLTVVSEKTGYPAEMLEPDMLLDADLGIDSIKRVEILAAIQEQLPDAPVVKPEHLGTLRTLGHIVEFLAGPAAVASTGAPATPSQTAQAPTTNHAAQIQDVLLTVVSEKTGYPAEMLEPDMLLDADLGIDSIKRVEILAAIQEQLPDAPVVKPEHLGTLRTLGHIVEFLAGAEAEATGPPEPLTPPSPAAHTNVNGQAESPGPKGGDTSRLAVSRRLVKVEQVASPESRPSVKVRAGGEYWIAGEDQELASALASRLLEVGHHPRIVTHAEVAGLTAPAQLDGLILIGGRDQRDDEQAGSAVKSSFQLLRTCAPGLRETGRNTGAVLATVTRLGGTFGLLGLAPQTSARPTSGALAGLTKTASHEWPEVACKAIDLDPAMTSPDEAANRVLEELFRQGPLEVGLSREGEVNTLVLEPETLGSEFNPATSSLKPGDVVVISGGARGVTAEAAVALARAFQPTIVLLGRSPEPTHEPAWLAPLTDEAEIKRALVARANGHATPQLIGSQFRDLTASREILANLARIEAAGARAFYYSVDVRDQDAVQARIDAIRNNHGPIRGLVHGAGVLADRRIEDQSDEQFASVFDTKVAGLRALLDASAHDDLRVLVLFSSSTARFGRTGQVAYAAANEVLNKWGQAEAGQRPSCRVVSVNWGPWNGGMVTPSLRPLFESEGIPLIPLLDGANYLARELRDPAGPVEIVILGPDPENPDPENSGSTSKSTAPTAAQPTGSASVPIFERALDLASAPVLGSHVIDGRPVLPMALILEWLAQGALQRNPGLVFAGIDDLRLHKGVVLHNNERPETLGVHASKAVRDGSDYRVEVEIRGVTSQGRALSHAKGVVILADRHAPGEPTLEERPLPPLSVGVADLYRDVLFHGPELQGLERVEGCDESGISATAATAPAPSTWLDRPLRQAWVADPLALDCAFQLMIVWSVERSGVGSLPTFVGRYRQFRRAFPAGGVRIVARVTEAGTHRARADIKFLDLDGELVARIDDYECVIDSSLNQAFRRNQLTSIG